MKTLPEILNKHGVWYAYGDNMSNMDTDKAVEAIAKELMGCLPEKSQGKYQDHICRFNDGEQSCECYTELADEVRARLTAFIGHKEK